MTYHNLQHSFLQYYLIIYKHKNVIFNRPPDRVGQRQRDHQLRAVQPEACPPSQQPHLSRLQRRTSDSKFKGRGRLSQDGNLL